MERLWKFIVISLIEYDFKYKPEKINKRPSIIPGHLPGLDWRIWFLGPAIIGQGVASLPEWYHSFIKALLEGRREVMNRISKVIKRFLSWWIQILFLIFLQSIFEQICMNINFLIIEQRKWKRKAIGIQVFGGSGKKKKSQLCI